MYAVDMATVGPDRVTLLQLLTEMTYPDYRDRHIFTARLRLFLLFAFLGFYVFVFADVVPATHPAMLLIGIAAILTTYGYYNIINAQWMVFSFAIEVLADLIGITTVIYLLGGVQSDYYLLYACYCLAAGLFFNYRIAATLALLCWATYAAYYWISLVGWLAPLTGAVAPDQLYSHHGPWEHPVWMHLVMLAVILAFCVYGIKTAQQFSWLREHALEARNRELMALQQIGSTIRAIASIETVAERVIAGIMGGLDLTGSLLWLVDRRAQRLVCYPPQHAPILDEIEQQLGFPLRHLSIPLQCRENIVVQQITQRQVVYRRNLSEVVIGMDPPVPADRLAQVQEYLGLQKIVVIPLIAEEEFLGALIGLSTEGFVEEQAVSTLQLFADQAALVLRVCLLIEQLREANRELIEANRVKGEFLATMSHELRTPLTAIIGFSELLVEGAMGPLTEEQLDSLREIRNNGASLLELINNILDLSRMESGRMTLNCESFDLHDLVDRVSRGVGSLVARKQQHYVLDVPPTLPPIVADERRLQQVVTNLVGNAIKFTPDGGTITVCVRHFAALDELQSPAGAPRDLDAAAFAGGGFRISVTDTGIGIPATHLATIFEMFRQVDSSVTRRYEGTGLGLALVRQLIELHRGVIWADSEEGRGAHFHCLLPAQGPPSAT